jgi:hypothetical protein
MLKTVANIVINVADSILDYANNYPKDGALPEDIADLNAAIAKVETAKSNLLATIERSK